MVKSCAIIFYDHVKIWSKYQVYGLEKSAIPLFENFQNSPKKTHFKIFTFSDFALKM
jgi:hypothetical protein